nr:MAG TPA: hypothetical protein [Caudoviricetes sp.]
MAAPAGAPRRRRVHPGMHASARARTTEGRVPDGACMTSLRTHRPGARAAERSGAQAP